WKDAEGDRVGEARELTRALVDTSAEVPGAEQAIGIVTGFTALAGKDGELIGDDFQSQGGNYWGPEDPR
ncbi:hypothetical protein JTP67_30860, partial [Streptomyces sp. S12]|nr:hypothetical protein [Streptomyces sp. S12]